jgi:hypothetical protein
MGGAEKCSAGVPPADRVGWQAGRLPYMAAARSRWNFDSWKQWNRLAE